MSKSDTLSERDTAKRRDAAIRVILNTPPKPFTKPAKKKRKAKTAQPTKAR